MSKPQPRESAWSAVVSYGLFLACAAWFTGNALGSVGYDTEAGWARFVMWAMLAIAAAAAPAALARVKPRAAGTGGD